MRGPGTVVQKHVRMIASAFLFFCIVFSGCDLVAPQVAGHIFAENRSLPSELEVLANPRVKGQRGLTRYFENRDPKGRVKVAVIDGGTDYTHPKLAGQIAFDVKNGEIVGAGLDLMGQDHWAHPNLINPLPYAFVASALEGSRLKGVSSDPIQEIMTIQQEFNTLLLAAVHADPALSDTLFQKKLTQSTLSIFAALSLVTESGFEKQTAYNLYKSDGLLISEKSASLPGVIKRHGKDVVDAIARGAWVGTESKGSPDHIETILAAVEGADLFKTHLKSSVDAIDKKHHLKERVARFVAYKKLLGSKSLGFSGLNTQELNQLWHRLEFNYSSVNPVFQFVTSFCESIPSAVKSQLMQPGLKNEDRVRIAKQEYVRELSVFSKIYNINQANGLDEVQKAKIAQDLISKLPRIFDEAFTEARFAKLLSCGPELADVTLRDPELIKFGEKRFHPYLKSGASENSHGTHVAGIIIRQNPKVDVFPIRVMTSTPAYLPEVADGIRRDFESGFAQWAAKPEVLKAAALMIPQVFGLRAQSMDQQRLVSLMTKHLDSTFSANYLGFYFFNQITQAIEEVGRRKIKIANLSLGTSFEKAVVQTGDEGLEDRVKNFMAFLVYEYFKFHVAETIERTSANTLFVIAAGNDGKWLDGKSRSGLPCDLSSNILKRAQAGSPKEAIVPNNRLNNIVCVGSIDSNEEISSFTNLPLTSVPFVLSYGESIRSTVAINDCEGSEQEVQDKYGKFKALPFVAIGSDSSQYDGALSELGLLTPSGEQGKVDELERIKAGDQARNLADTLSAKLKGTLVEKFCQHSPLSFARMSGTSMATPAVAGFLASSLASELTREGLTSEQAYDLPQYSPSHLIKMMKEKSAVFGDESMLKDVAKVTEIKSWSQIHKQNLSKVLGVIQPAELLK